MGKLLKILFTVIATLILLIIVAAVVLPLVIDPNDFKPQIQAAVKDNTGRDLAIEGDLDLSVFPWLGVSTGKLSLSNAAGFDEKPFARIDQSDIKVKLMPLLSKKVEVSRIVLKGLALNLAKNKKGVANWDDLVSAKQDAAAEKGPQPAEGKESPAAPGDVLAALAIGGLSIENANIVWDDREAGKHLEIQQFNLETDELALNEPMGIDLSMTLVNKEPQLTESIKFKTDIVVNEKLDNIRLTSLKLDSETGGKSIPGGTMVASLQSDVAMDLEKQTLEIIGLRLTSGDLTMTADIKGSNIKDKPVFSGPIGINQFNLMKFLRQMSVDVPAMRDPGALSKLAAKFDLQASDTSADLRNLSVTLDDSNVTGFVTVNNFASPSYQFSLALDAIDADRYLSPADTKGEAKPSSAATPAAAAAAGAALLPVETLRSLNANGDLTIGRLKINNLKMQGIKLKLNAANSLVTTQQSVDQFYQGSYAGRTKINVKGKQPAMELDEKLSNIAVEPLLQDMQQSSDARMTGKVNANAKLKTYGNTAEAMKSSLDGNLDFKVSDGVVRGFNLQKMIDNTKALIEGTPLPTENKNDQTVFSEISGSANIVNGLVQNDDLQALSSRLRVDGQGTANLVTEQLDYKINAKLIKKATADQPEKVKAVPLILNIGGSFSKPSYTLDIPAMLLEKNKDKIEKKKEEVLQKLDEKLGPGVGDLLKGFFK